MPYDPPKGTAPIAAAQAAGNTAAEPMATQTGTVTQTGMPVSRDSVVAFGIASTMLDVANAIPQLFIGSAEKANLEAARSVLADVVTNQGRTDAGSVMARTQAAAATVQATYNSAIQRRMYVIGGAGGFVVLGLGYWFFVRK